jgi:UDP-glucose 4-epimerase
MYTKPVSKVAIIGGCGFIGSNLFYGLLSRGDEVIVIDDLSTGLESNLPAGYPNLRKTSILDGTQLFEELSMCEVFFHLAARGSVPRSIANPLATHMVNATGTLNILEVARKSGAQVVFSSSSSVYGRNTDLPKIENMWLGPMTPYAASKLSAEAYVQAYSSSYGVPTTLLRFFNIYGPRQRPDHQYAAVIPKWIWSAMNGREIDVFGDGETTRDFTYVDTVVEILISAMENKRTTEGPVNLAFGNRISLNSIVDLLRQEFPKVKVNYREQRPGDVRDSQNSPILIKELFPEVEPIGFEEGFKKTMDWLMEHGDSIANGPETLD